MSAVAGTIRLEWLHPSNASAAPKSLASTMAGKWLDRLETRINERYWVPSVSAMVPNRPRGGFSFSAIFSLEAIFYG